MLSAVVSPIVTAVPLLLAALAFVLTRRRK